MMGGVAGQVCHSVLPQPLAGDHR